MAYSMFCTKCEIWIHGRCVKRTRVTPVRLIKSLYVQDASTKLKED